MPLNEQDWILFSITSAEDFKYNLLYLVGTMWVFAALVLTICTAVYSLRNRIILQEKNLQIPLRA